MSRNVSDNLISPRAADLLISMRDGEATLLYLYFCRNGFHDPERARKELYMTRQRFQEACERLEMQGLLTRIGAGEVSPAADVSAEKQPPAAADMPGQNGDLPSYSAVDVSTRAGVDSAFAAVLTEAKLILGRPLSTPDLIKMLGIYDHFGLPAEVMMELMLRFADQTEAVQVWGITDNMSWRSQSYPLLFDKFMNPKPAFYAVLEAAGK